MSPVSGRGETEEWRSVCGEGERVPAGVRLMEDAGDMVGEREPITAGDGDREDAGVVPVEEEGERTDEGRLRMGGKMTTS